MSAAVLLGPLRPRDPARADSALRDACEEVNRLLWSRLGEWLAGKAYRVRDPARVAEDVATLHLRHGARHFEITDEALARHAATR